ncbi:MAG: hypothetical protein HOI73_06055 [Alphaproteobacteria bacterium]|jgi:hypothetical protein|nr:hypothetical protein [Alphaproteobacteria bacterium]MBT5481250.1 hypothetical protein [Alphaproteobacteria bacterium]MBT5728966.1 hypothetical protein [Alphaproteobacteria bacterium]MDB0028107.1 hypothetical protein [Alphaproteobacteria bacterium]
MKKKRVISSHNNETGSQCVDVFIVNEQFYGFCQYRRDIEDQNGWFIYGSQSDAVYVSYDEAYLAATKAISWLAG